jgi:hypothetical protein
VIAPQNFTWHSDRVGTSDLPQSLSGGGHSYKIVTLWKKKFDNKQEIELWFQ